MLGRMTTSQSHLALTNSLRGFGPRSRRSHAERTKTEEENSVYINGDLKIDFTAGCVYMNDAEIHLTPIEYKLLCLLAHNTGKVLTHNYILQEVWGNTLASDVPSLCGCSWRRFAKRSKRTLRLRNIFRLISASGIE